MGIKGLSTFLKKRYPELYTNEVHLSVFKYKKIAIDTSLFLYKFKAICGEDGWISAFTNLVLVLRSNDIHCVFIYDTSAPIEKTVEREERRERRDKLEKTVYELEYDFNILETTGIMSERLRELSDKIEKTSTTPRRLLQPCDNKITIDDLREKIEKKKRQVITVTKEDFETSKRLFEILKIPYFDAPEEAEMLCSQLCKMGIVDGVLTEDSDVLAYGCPVMLTKINTASESCIVISYDKVLDMCNMTPEQFLDFCIMCGSDYNKNIPKIGPVMSFKLIQEHGSVTGIPETIDTSILNYNRTREIFTQKYTGHIKRIPYCAIPDFSLVDEFLFKNNIRISFDKFKKSMTINFEFN